MVHSLSQAAAQFLTVATYIETWKLEALEGACKIVEEEAKDVIGTYRYNWPQLAESTQADREHKGYPPNEPLLREGTLRDSIEHTVIPIESAGYVGSNNKIAVYQELGTNSIPPRSFLEGAARAKEGEIYEKWHRGMYLAIATKLGLEHAT